MDTVFGPSVLEAMRVTPVTPLRQGTVKPRTQTESEKWSAPSAVARGQLIDLIV